MSAGDEAGALGLIDRALGSFEALGTLDGPGRSRCRLTRRLTSPSRTSDV